MSLYLTTDIPPSMERPAAYGSKEHKSCNKCSWTSPLESFDLIPALISRFARVKCPNCGELLLIDVGSFHDEPFLLPKGFSIVSGGQTGVDRGALDAAIHLGIPHGGWCPGGRKAEDGKIPAKYNLKEMATRYYWKRTEQNVLDSDGTLIFPGEKKSKGTALTIRLAKKHNKPVAIIPLDSPDTTSTMLAWLRTTQIKVLNVAGPRESGSIGISATTKRFLINALNQARQRNYFVAEAVKQNLYSTGLNSTVPNIFCS